MNPGAHNRSDDGGFESPGRVRRAHGLTAEIRSVSKTFPGGQRVLDGVSLNVRSGEIHGLVGENGSGKSTLIKILSGYHTPDPGSELRFNGEAVQFPISTSHHQGFVRVLHQDLGLVDSLSVTDNLLIEQYQSGGIRKLSRRKERDVANSILSALSLDVDPSALVASLSDELRAAVAIARTVSAGQRRAGLVIFDEPTVHLSRPAARRLFELMRSIAAQDAGVLFVSHYLNEVLELSDRVTVLRDGRVVSTVESKSADEDHLIRLIVGRELGTLYPSPTAQTEQAVRLSVEGVRGATVSDATFHVKAGEILGLTGLLGAGFAEAPYLIAGATRIVAGTVKLDGTAFSSHHDGVRERIERGVVLVPANRASTGIATSMTIRENLTLPVIGRFFRHGSLSRKRERALASDLVSRFDVRPNDPERITNTLSGGNQQKVVLAKWLALDPRVLILHEPAQGVDVGARQQIFGEISRAAAAGAAVVIATVEHEALAEVCDRVLVFGRGRVVSELVGEQLAKDRIAEQCFAAARNRADSGPTSASADPVRTPAMGGTVGGETSGRRARRRRNPRTPKGREGGMAIPDGGQRSSDACTKLDTEIAGLAALSGRAWASTNASDTSEHEPEATADGDRSARSPETSGGQKGDVDE